MPTKRHSASAGIEKSLDGSKRVFIASLKYQRWSWDLGKCSKPIKLSEGTSKFNWSFSPSIANITFAAPCSWESFSRDACAEKLKETTRHTNTIKIFFIFT